MKISVLRERAEGETRVAATPETVRKLVGLGASVAIEAGAGAAARFPDAEYQKAGATVRFGGGHGQGRRYRSRGSAADGRRCSGAPSRERW